MSILQKNHLYKLVTACWLHDIGKIVVPLEVLDKPNRLDHRYQPIMDRYDKIQMTLERNYYRALVEGVSENEERLLARFEVEKELIEEYRDFITETNDASLFVDDERIESLQKLYDTRIDGIEDVLLTDEELLHLSIRKGTLTDDERKLVQKHMTAGTRILSELEFPDYLENIFDWIINHHEYLNGSGYPRAISNEDIALESRMMTICDIYDSLVQSDRPYKKAYEHDKAIQILKYMTDEGKLDGDLVKAYIESDLWRVNIEEESL